VEDQLAAAIGAGVDVLSGFNDHARILGLVSSGRVTQARVDESVRRLLREQFVLGLFENPYVDAERAATTVGKPEFAAKASTAQRRSIVLLQNNATMLPLAAASAVAPVRVYTMGMSRTDVEAAGYMVTTGDHADTAPRPPVAAGTRYALVRVTVTNPVRPLDRTLAIYFRQPYVLDEASGLRQAGAIVGLFGASDAALMDVLTGKFPPTGTLPFALANSPAAIVRQAPDAPGYPPEDTLFPFGFGLQYR